LQDDAWILLRSMSMLWRGHDQAGITPEVVAVSASIPE